MSSAYFCPLARLVTSTITYIRHARTEAQFVKQIKTSLKCADAIPNAAMSEIISKLFVQRDYGVIPSDLGSSSAKVPVGLQYKCWEALLPDSYFSVDTCQVLAQRKLEREEARNEVVRLLSSMSHAEMLEWIKADKADKAEAKEDKADKDKVKVEKPKKVKEPKEPKAPKEPNAVVSKIVTPKKEPIKERSATSEASPRTGRASREGTANTVDSRRSASPVKKSKMTPEEVRP